MKKCVVVVVIILALTCLPPYYYLTASNVRTQCTRSTDAYTWSVLFSYWNDTSLFKSTATVPFLFLFNRRKKSGLYIASAHSQVYFHAPGFFAFQKWVNSSHVSVMRGTKALDTRRLQLPGMTPCLIDVARDRLYCAPFIAEGSYSLHHDLQFNPQTQTWLALQRKPGKARNLEDHIIEIALNGSLVHSWPISTLFPCPTKPVPHLTDCPLRQTCGHKHDTENEDVNECHKFTRCIDCHHTNSLYWDISTSMVYLSVRNQKSFFKWDYNTKQPVWYFGAATSSPSPSFSNASLSNTPIPLPFCPDSPYTLNWTASYRGFHHLNLISQAGNTTTFSIVHNNHPNETSSVIFVMVNEHRSCISLLSTLPVGLYIHNGGDAHLLPGGSLFVNGGNTATWKFLTLATDGQHQGLSQSVQPVTVKMLFFNLHTEPFLAEPYLALGSCPPSLVSTAIPEHADGQCFCVANNLPVREQVHATLSAGVTKKHVLLPQNMGLATVCAKLPPSPCSTAVELKLENGLTAKLALGQ